MNRQKSIPKIDSQSSPTKKFRSTLINNFSSSQKIMPSFNAYIKQYPLQIDESIIQIVKMIQPLQNDFVQNLSKLKLYKQQLGMLFEENWFDFLAYLKTIIIKMNKRTQKLLNQKQLKINQLLTAIKNIDIQKIQLKTKLQKSHNLRQMQNSQLQMANNQLDIVNREMRSIYKILQSDMSQVMTFLTSLQQNKSKRDQSISNQMNQSLNNLSSLMQSIEKEQVQTGSTLSTMKEMIKAMTKSTKVSTGVQVDQSQLQTNVGQIFTKPQVSMPIEVEQAISVNVAELNQKKLIIQKLKQKQKEIPPEMYVPKKAIQRPWTLTPVLLVFLENMSKQNQIGRVLPYQFVKGFIAEVYQERIKYDAEISTSIVGNSMAFDQFVVFYFLNKYKIRRLAQVKLLQMIISLKYYAKFWSRAQTFCFLMQVMKYQPSNDPNDNPAYKFDQFTQNFFFSIYKHIQKFNFYHDDDGTVYISTKNTRSIIRVTLFFVDDMTKSRILSRIQKNLRIFQETQYCDLDYTIQMILDQFFNMRKKNLNSIAKSFSKLYNKNKGYFSISQTIDVFDCLSSLYKKFQDPSQQYPIQSQIYIIKLYLYSITTGKNNYQIVLNNFMTAVQKYGFDSPYPFIKTVMKKKQSAKLDQKKIHPQNIKNQIIQIDNKLKKQQQKFQQFQKKTQQKDQNHSALNKSLNTIRIDIGSKVFSQHFSILKQLMQYVKTFSQVLQTQKNPQTLWKSFNQIKVILQRGCQFLKFPLIKQMINK